MSRFTDRLWSDLVRAHGADLSNLPRPPARSRRRPRMLAGTGLGLVAAGSAAAIVVATAGTTPAFAVTKNHDGSVTVSIARPAGIPQANARLAALGYRARIVQVTAGCGGPAAWARSIHPPRAVFRQIRAGARFDPRQVPPGRFLVMPAWRLGGKITIHRGHVVQGQVPACLPPPPIPVPGAIGGACCPLPVFMGRPGRQFLRRPPRPVLARPCPNVRRQRLSRPPHFQVPGGPRSQIPGGGQGGGSTVQIPGGGQLQISGGPHLQISMVPHAHGSSGPRLQITAGRPNVRGRGAAWIHISVSCPAPVASLIPGPGQSSPRPKHR